MRREVRGVLSTVLAVGLLLAASAAPAAARTTGSESVRGVIVTSGQSGTRTVVNSVAVARGVFNGVGRIVEVDSLPGDPENVSRDDIVFRQGTLHIVSTNHSMSVSLNSRTCTFRVRIEQTTKVTGGTGLFSHASGNFAGTVRARGRVARDPDGRCSMARAPLFEVDRVAASGTLSY
jgi:hypothetical protein